MGISSQTDDLVSRIDVDIHAEPNDQLPGTCVDAIAAAANGTATNVKNDLVITYPFNNSHDKQK